MWKKDDAEKSKPPPFVESTDNDTRAASFSTSPPAVVGASLTISGNISGKEDLLVDGKVDGDIVLPDNVVTVGSSGVVKARIQAAVIIVEGRVEGDLLGEEQIEVRRSGNVQGNITAPRVGLEDGAQFKGNIDMSPKSGAAAKSPLPATPNKVEKKPDVKPFSPNSDAKLSG